MLFWIVIGAILLGGTGVLGILLYGITRMTISEDFDERER